MKYATIIPASQRDAISVGIFFDMGFGYVDRNATGHAMRQGTLMPLASAGKTRPVLDEFENKKPVPFPVDSDFRILRKIYKRTHLLTKC